jgi:hypothetical protein
MAGMQGRFSRDDVYMPITPMFHVHAWGFPWSATLAGVKQVYPGRYEPAMLVKLIKTEGVTFTHGVPTILQMLLNAAAAANVDLSGLKMVIGGSALPKALAKQALAAGIDIFAGYGMSETGPLAAVSHVRSKDLTGDPDGEVDFRTRAGMAGPLVDLRIVDSDMNDVPHDGKSPGEIVLRAPWLTQGYFNSPETSEQLWAGGYLHTSDIAVISPDGYVHITDRIKDVIKTGGEWLHTNNAQVFRAYRSVEGGPEDDLAWRPMRQGVCDLYRRTEVSQKINERYLDAFAALDDTTRMAELIRPLQQSCQYRNRQVRALRPFADDFSLLEAVNRGEFMINGVRNRDLQRLLWSTQTNDPKEKRRRSAAVSRKLRMLAAHALGFAASWLTEWYSYDRRVLDALGVAPNEKIAGFVHIGRPAKPIEDRPRPPLDQIVTRFGAN